MGGGLKNFRTQANGGNRIKNDLINELLEAGGSFIQNSGKLYQLSTTLGHNSSIKSPTLN